MRVAGGQEALDNCPGKEDAQCVPIVLLVEALTMKKAVSLAAILVVLTVPAFSQVETVKLKIRAVLVDKDLNQKPAPRLTLVVVRYDVADAEPATAKTSFDGTAELQLIPGRYRITTPEPIEFQGKRYSWEMEMTVAAPEASVELSNDNAKIADVPQGKPIRTMDDLASLFKKYQNCVVTVWSEFGHGTGFVVDPAGLILTNQHVIGPSEYVAVQFDEKRKVEAKVVAFDPEKDIAVLWASLAPFKEVIVAPLANSNQRKLPLWKVNVFSRSVVL